MRTSSKIQTLILTLLLSTYIPASSFGVDGQRKLTQPVPPAAFPIIINQPGSYVLTSNLVVPAELLNVNAIEIRVNDVTLDLNGHKIQGPHTGPPWGGSGNGIYALDRYNLTIRNGRIWGFGNGGLYLNSTGGNPTENSAGHYTEGIQSANNGTFGILIFGGQVVNCTANNNGNDTSKKGIQAFYSSVINCTASNNGNGISTDNSTVTNCTANKNVYIGIGATNSTLTGCTANWNAAIGINANYSTAAHCTANYNTARGFSVDHSTLSNCSSILNFGQGIWAGTGNRIEKCNVRHNGQGGTGYGIYLWNSGQRNFVISNTASDNASGNFRDEGNYNYMPVAGDNANYGW